MTENSGEKATAEAPEPVAEGTPTAELERLRSEADEARDRYLRTAAELDNLRKRAARELENARAYGNERFAGELLSVVDSLEMGVSAGAEAGEAHFRKVVQRKELPDDIVETRLEATAEGLALLEILEQLGWIQSRGEGRRLVAQGGVRVEGEKAEDPTARYESGATLLIQAGKRRFARVVLASD